jgi:chromosome segregation ATPase
MTDRDPDWLGELRWQGYPRMAPRRDASAIPEDAPRAAPQEKAASAPDPRLGELAKENEALRGRLDALLKLASEFDRRLADAATAHEVAVMQTESRARDAALERERLAGELEAAKAECARLAARDAAREADLRLERERRSDSEKALGDARRRLGELSAQEEHWRAAAAEQAGALAELRRQASAQHERILQSKALTDQDVHLLRQELRDFLAKFHRIQESSGENS